MPSGSYHTQPNYSVVATVFFIYFTNTVHIIYSSTCGTTQLSQCDDHVNHHFIFRAGASSNCSYT